MGIPRFFVEDLVPGRVDLPPEEAAHARQSRRLPVGEQIALFDGRGGEGMGRIVAADRSRVTVDVTQAAVRERMSPQLTLAVAMPKGPRQDFLMEKCTELGVVAIWPLVTLRSVSGASEHRLDKWRRTAIEAAKQSGQCWIPDLSPPRTLEEVVRQGGTFERQVMAVGGETRPFELCTADRILALVGPEGGWAPEELDMASAAGFESVTLGPNVLRIETAALSLAAIVHAAGKMPRKS